MQPAFEIIETGVNQSFYVNHLKTERFPSPLHFHPEIEILLIVEGAGTRLIGDSVGRFSPGELIMIGSNVPHVWYSDKTPNDQAKPFPETIYIQFLKDILGEQFLNLPEIKNIQKLLQLSTRGIRLTGKTREKVAEKIKSLLNSDGFHRIMILLTILQLISESDEYQILASPVIQNNINQKNSSKLNTIYKHILKNYNEDLKLDDIAALVNLSSSAFCRYFKSVTNKTFIQFLNEIRVGHACRLLHEDENYSISEVCYMCGFNNTSYFIKQFRRITGNTPLTYKKRIDQE